MFDAHGILKSANTTTSNVGTGLSADLRSVPAPVDKSIHPAAVQSVEPLPEEDQPAPENAVETSPE
ncbi:hypothetical protein [Paraburkholderia hospita]|uniref:hypothetical protein n=1 Tax=Paraburkholderia hospita TaxID=169430 RepID=UPI003ECF1CC8